MKILHWSIIKDKDNKEYSLKLRLFKRWFIFTYIK